MKYEQTTGFKDTLSSCVPIIETVDVKEHKDTTKTRATCELCNSDKVRYVSTVSGMVLMCKKCEKETTITLYIADKQLRTDIQIVDMVEWLTRYQLNSFRLSTESTALKNPITRSLMVNIKDKFNMKLTPSKGKLTPYLY